MEGNLCSRIKAAVFSAMYLLLRHVLLPAPFLFAACGVQFHASLLPTGRTLCNHGRTLGMPPANLIVRPIFLKLFVIVPLHVVSSLQQSQKNIVN